MSNYVCKMFQKVPFQQSYSSCLITLDFIILYVISLLFIEVLLWRITLVKFLLRHRFAIFLTETVITTCLHPLHLFIQLSILCRFNQCALTIQVLYLRLFLTSCPRMTEGFVHHYLLDFHFDFSSMSCKYLELIDSCLFYPFALLGA